MAIIPVFRVIIFTFITLLSLVVLGICTHLEYLIFGYMDVYVSFIPFGLGAAGLTILSLPLFLVLGNLRRRVFTSRILFEIIWFLILWVVWAGAAGDTVFANLFDFPGGCIYGIYPMANQICYEFTVVEAFALANFFCAFIYHVVILLYAIINAIRGRRIWTASVREAASGISGAVNPAPMVQPQLNAAPATQHQNYGAYPPNVPPTQPYNAYPQQVPPQALISSLYNAYPQQAPPQGSLPQPYNAYPHEAPSQAFPTIYSGQNQSYNYNPSPAAPQQQVNYAAYSLSPTTNDAPNDNSYPVNDTQVPLPLPSGYQEQSIPLQEQSPPPYDSHLDPLV